MTQGPEYSGHKKQNEIRIAKLANSLVYLMEHVFILQNEDGYRLVAIRNNKLVTDQYYPTLKGAKISFARVFRKNKRQKNKTPVWSCFFPPDQQWMAEKWEIINRDRRR